MTRARTAAASLVTLLLGLAGCAQAPALPFRVVSAPPDDPFAFADAIVVAIERDGELDPTTERSFDPAATAFPVRGLSFGERLQVRIEARAGGLVLGRGRSLPFDYRDPSQAPSPGAADVLVGTLGAFVTPIDGALASPLLVAPSLVVREPARRGDHHRGCAPRVRRARARGRPGGARDARGAPSRAPRRTVGAHGGRAGGRGRRGPRSHLADAGRRGARVGGVPAD